MHPHLVAYEVFGAWAIYDEDNALIEIARDDFGDFLDAARAFGYDVLINTDESWKGLS